MKTFISSNGINMVECQLYNWRVEPIYHGKPEPTVYVMNMGSMSQMYQALYDPKTEILSLCDIAYSSDEVFRFYCSDLEEAEVIVAAFIKANEMDMEDTIYLKK